MQFISGPNTDFKIYKEKGRIRKTNDGRCTGTINFTTNYVEETFMIGIEENDNGTKRGVRETMKRMEKDLTEETKAELEAIWSLIEQAAVDLCPKDTGALASTVKSSEGGGEGTISASSDIFNKSLIAGDDGVINPKTGKPTSMYAGLVHDGHTMRDGTMWEGIPFLVEALLMYEGELEQAVDKAVQNIQEGSE